MHRNSVLVFNQKFVQVFNQLLYLVGFQLSPNNLGGGVEGELHSDRGELQLLDGVGL